MTEDRDDGEGQLTFSIEEEGCIYPSGGKLDLFLPLLSLSVLTTASVSWTPSKSTGVKFVLEKWVLDV